MECRKSNRRSCPCRKTTAALVLVPRRDAGDLSRFSHCRVGSSVSQVLNVAFGRNVFGILSAFKDGKVRACGVNVFRFSMHL